MQLYSALLTAVLRAMRVGKFSFLFLSVTAAFLAAATAGRF